jgi:peptidoglycan LD-endopeptidase CwlK
MNLALLTSDFCAQVELLLAACAERGVVLRPYNTVRTPHEQAQLWARSRTTQQMQNAITYLRQQRAPRLAALFAGLRCSDGRWATNALPGNSWHQWGEALDCYVEENHKAVWSGQHVGYKVYAEEAQKLGLSSGYWWKVRDAVHVQLRSSPSPSNILSWAAIEAEMVKRFRI